MKEPRILHMKYLLDGPTNQPTDKPSDWPTNQPTDQLTHQPTYRQPQIGMRGRNLKVNTPKEFLKVAGLLSFKMKRH